MGKIKYPPELRLKFVLEYLEGNLGYTVLSQKYNVASHRDFVSEIVGYNNGTISNCSVSGNLVTPMEVSGIVGYNYYGVIEKCNVKANLNDPISKIAGIAIENAHYNGEKEELYYSGSFNNCYVVSAFDYETNAYPIACNIENSESIIENCYYDKAVSGLNSTTYGTPKSTSAMKMIQNYQANWDFNTVWGIDKNINDGYPYLIWEYPDMEEETPYTINSVKITDTTGAELEAIPDDSFYFEINATKNDNSKNADCLVIAIYDENGSLMEITN